MPSFSFPPTLLQSGKKKKKEKNKPKLSKQMVSPLWQFVAWSQFLELSNKSQENSDYNGKADRHLTLMVQTEGTQAHTGVSFPTLNVHRLLTNVLFF